MKTKETIEYKNYMFEVKLEFTEETDTNKMFPEPTIDFDCINGWSISKVTNLKTDKEIPFKKLTNEHTNLFETYCLNTDMCGEYGIKFKPLTNYIDY